MPPLLEVKDLTVRFRSMGALRQAATGGRAPFVEAVAGVSFELEPARTLALVGESGSGKTTLGRALIGLVEPSSGRIRFEGADRPGRQSLRPGRNEQPIQREPRFLRQRAERRNRAMLVHRA